MFLYHFSSRRPFWCWNHVRYVCLKVFNLNLILLFYWSVLFKLNLCPLPPPLPSPPQAQRIAQAELFINVLLRYLFSKSMNGLLIALFTSHSMTGTKYKVWRRIARLVSEQKIRQHKLQVHLIFGLDPAVRVETSETWRGWWGEGEGKIGFVRVIRLIIDTEQSLETGNDKTFCKSAWPILLQKALFFRIFSRSCSGHKAYLTCLSTFVFTKIENYD